MDLVDPTVLFEAENHLIDRSFSFLRSDETRQRQINFFDLLVVVNHAWIMQNPKPSEDEMTIQFIGARLFNQARVSYRCLLSGYYQTSVSIQRDIIEIQFLLDYFHTDKPKIKEWRESDNLQRFRKFSPGVLYPILDKRDGFEEGKRKKQYQMFCEYAAHVSYPGMKLMANNANLIEAGPFYDEHKLIHTLIELNRRYAHAVITLTSLLSLTKAECIGLFLELGNQADAIIGTSITKGKSYIYTQKTYEDYLKQNKT
jgi:hypothetical protein